MRTDENKHNSPEHKGDALDMIRGIGPAFATALNKIGIYRFADLAQYTPAQLSQALLDQAGVRVPPERIETNDWIGQAGVLAASVAAAPPAQEEAEAAAAREKTHSPGWRQHAGFSVFFDYVPGEQGQQAWQTRVYHDESGKEMLFPGTETSAWVAWIAEQADLPLAAPPTIGEPEAAAEPVLVEAPVPVPAAPAPPEPARLVISDVVLSQVSRSAERPQAMLMAKVRLYLAGEGAEQLLQDRRLLWIQLYITNVESGTTSLVSSEKQKLQPAVYELTSQQTFPVPDFGNYELQAVALLPPPGELIAFHEDVPFVVVP